MNLCEICKDDRKIFYSTKCKQSLCVKHYMQLKRFEKIRDNTPSIPKKNNEWIKKKDHYILRIHTKNKYNDVLIDLNDFAKVSRYHWNIISNRYVIHAKSKTYLSNLLLNSKDVNKKVLHIDGNSLDNRKENLKIIDIHKYLEKGISFDKDTGKYVIYLYMGRYNTLKEAQTKKKTFDKILQEMK